MCIGSCHEVDVLGHIMLFVDFISYNRWIWSYHVVESELHGPTTRIGSYHTVSVILVFWSCHEIGVKHQVTY